METTETYSSNNRYWWLMLIIGILSILCGIWVFRNPVESYFALAVYFSIMFILYGIGEIVNAFAGQRYRNWGWGLAVGILDLVIGFILLGNLAWAADLCRRIYLNVRRYRFYRSIQSNAIFPYS